MEPFCSPLHNKISFFGIFESLEALSKSQDPFLAQHAQSVLDEVNEFPELREGFEDRELLKTYAPQIEKLMTFVFPEALTNNEIKAAIPAFDFMPFHTSARLAGMLEKSGGELDLRKSDLSEDRKYILAGVMILNFCYQMPINLKMPMTVEIKDKKTKVIRHYKVAYNADFLKIFPGENAPKITKQDYLDLLDDYDNIDLWKEKIPPNSHHSLGFGVMNLMDVTHDHTLSMVTSNLLTRTHDSLLQIDDNMRDLLDLEDLKVTFSAYEKPNVVFTQEAITTSLMTGLTHRMDIKQDFCGYSYEQLIVQNKPLVASDVELLDKLSQSTLSKNILESGVKSFIAYPLVYEGELLAFLELGAPEKYQLNTTICHKLDSVIPMLAMAAKQFREEHKIRIEAIIQEECTTIHSSVKWRFEEEAIKSLGRIQHGEQADFQNIVFKDIYPLFGQLDIRGSSSLRNEGVQADMQTQMKGVLDVLDVAQKQQTLPILDELSHRVQGFLKEVSNGLLVGSEQRMTAFLKSEVYPVFEHLKSTDKVTAVAIETFDALLDPELDIVYKERKAFDDSVMLTNQHLASILDEHQFHAQGMFPHYFERYKTDGVEFNMYIGASIVKDKAFDPIYLNNLRLWQLLVMCEMENKFQILRKTLPKPLQVASLILVNNASLSIQFRLDEKRFDVEGAYNARYEIIKKRVDKAVIKGTNERVTEVGKIAIIYTAESEAREYQHYIEYAQAKGLLKDEPIEHLELEDLPGVTGLRALRVAIQFSGNTDEDAGLSYADVLNIPASQAK